MQVLSIYEETQVEITKVETSFKCRDKKVGDLGDNWRKREGSSGRNGGIRYVQHGKEREEGDLEVRGRGGGSVR